MMDTETMNAFVAHHVVNHENEMIKIASKHDGKVVGEYLHRVFIPLMRQEKFVSHFSQVMLWFTQGGKVQSFLDGMKDTLTKVKDGEYELVNCGLTIAKVKIILAATIPFGNLDIGFLIGSYLADDLPEVQMMRDDYAKHFSVYGTIFDTTGYLLESVWAKKAQVVNDQDSKEVYPGWSVIDKDLVRSDILTTAWDYCASIRSILCH